uniref:EF-hand domain-containing protein n=1 Tax=Octactis speculum TaxID=3111310 RepID=A0A7S2G7H7_9STRA
MFTVLDADNGGTLSIEELVAPLEDMSTIENPQFQMIYGSLIEMGSTLPAQYETVEGMDRVACHIAGLEPGTFSDGAALKAKFVEAAQLSNSRYVMDKEDFVNLLLSQTQVNVSKVFAAAIHPVMEFAKGPNSGLNARFTSSLRTGLEALGQWLEGGGMKGLIISCCDLFDANGDGQIDINELERMITKPQNAKEFLTLLFAIADGDSDGELTEKEVMNLVHNYVKVIVAVLELVIDGMVEVSMAAVRPVVTSILDAYNAPLGFTFETLSAAIKEGPEATSQRLMILGMSLQHTMQMAAMAASADMQMN